MRDSESIASESDPDFECEQDNKVDTTAESTAEATGGQNRDGSTTDTDISDGYTSNSSIRPDILEGTLDDKLE